MTVKAAPELTSGLVALFAIACGLIVGNLYYAQPILELIGPDVGLDEHALSLVVSLTQIGYVAGMLFVAPLGDLMENRRLIVVMVLASALCLLIAPFCRNGGLFLIVSLLIGLATVTVQMLIPLAAHLSPDARRGQVVGTIMGGLLLGILLSRPASSLIADHGGWKAVYFLAGGLMLGVAAFLRLTLPVYRPQNSTSYGALIVSLKNLWGRLPILRERALIQAGMFCAFSLFWTVVPMELSRHFHLSQTHIALFALAGAAGAVAAPLAGRLADKGYGPIVSPVVALIGALSLVLSFWGPGYTVIGLALTGVVLDFCVQMSMVTGQRAIYALEPQSRARINGIYMATLFTGGAIGTSVASTLYETGGWRFVAIAGTVACLISLLIVINGRRSEKMA